MGTQTENMWRSFQDHRAGTDGWEEWWGKVQDEHQEDGCAIDENVGFGGGCFEEEEGKIERPVLNLLKLRRHSHNSKASKKGTHGELYL